MKGGLLVEKTGREWVAAQRSKDTGAPGVYASMVHVRVGSTLVRSFAPFTEPIQKACGVMADKQCVAKLSHRVYEGNYAACGK